jgi:hypothetical protein
MLKFRDKKGKIRFVQVENEIKEVDISKEEKNRKDDSDRPKTIEIVKK